MRPVRPTAASNSATWLSAFWPVTASSTKMASCGALGSKRLTTRLIFASSTIRFVFACRRPAVSASTTSTPRAFAATRASWITAALSAPWPCAITGTPLRSPQTCSCSTAAARKVSPAASSAERPSACRRRASLPRLVVLPAPFTPTAKTTNGFWDASTANGRAMGVSWRSSSSCNRRRSAATSASSARATLRRKASMVCMVASTPTSALSKAVSKASNASSSMVRRPAKRSPKPAAKRWRVLPRPALRRRHVPPSRFSSRTASATIAPPCWSSPLAAGAQGNGNDPHYRR